MSGLGPNEQKRNQVAIVATMHKTMKIRTIITALSLATLLAGAASADQAQLAASIKETRLEAGKTRDQLVATLATLTALTKQDKGDLHPAYQAFTAEVPKTEAAAAVTRSRVAWMQGDGLKYFADWQKTVDTINNESLRKNAQKRLDAAKKSYGKVTASFMDAGEKFKPFLADLGDIQKALANDVTPGGIKALRRTVSDANWRFKTVNRTINDALDEMQKMERSLSTEVK
jgi:hypothetical protein